MNLTLRRPSRAASSNSPRRYCHGELARFVDERIGFLMIPFQRRLRSIQVNDEIVLFAAGHRIGTRGLHTLIQCGDAGIFCGIEPGEVGSLGEEPPHSRGENS